MRSLVFPALAALCLSHARANDVEAVLLNPLGLAPEDVVVGGANDRSAVLPLNLALVRRIVLHPEDVREGEFTVKCQVPGQRIDALARGTGAGGETFDLGAQDGLRSFQLRAGQELVFTVWKQSWHWNGGGTFEDLQIVRIGDDGSRTAVKVPLPGTQSDLTTPIGTFAFAGLSNRDRFPLVAEREAVVAASAKSFNVPSGHGVSVSAANGALSLHTNGRASAEPKFNWAPALVFTPSLDGTFAVEGRLKLRADGKDPKMAWMIGRISPKGKTLKGTRLVFHRMLRKPEGRPVAGVDYEAKPLWTAPLSATGDGASPNIKDGVAEALRSWLTGAWSDQGVLVRAEGDDGAPADVMVGKDIRGAIQVTVHPKHVLFEAPTRIQPGVYATMRDGRLFYGDKRLRLWSMVKDGTGARYRQLGFNGWRTWFQADFYNDESAKAGVAMTYVKGDGSKLDRYDALFADMKANDVFVMFGTMIGLGMPVKAVAQEGSWMHARHGSSPEWKTWSESVMKAAGPDYHGLVYLMSYADDWLWEIRLRHAENVLNHVNPYTGRRYAEEEAIVLIEINNEAAHVKTWIERGFEAWPEYFRKNFNRRWCAYLSGKYADDAALRKAWGELGDGETIQGASPHVRLEAASPKSVRRVDYQTFLMELVDRRNQEYIAFCRAQAPKGVGVNVVPFSCDSMFRPSIPWAWANWRADSSTVSMYFWNNGTMLASPPGLYVMDSHRLDGRISSIYETGRGRPSRCRTETPYMLSVFADWQDFDIVSWHGSWFGGASNEDVLAGTAQPPTSSHFWTAVHLENDPVMNSAVAMAGRLYLAGVIGTATDPAIYQIGAEGIFGTAAWNGVGGADMSRRVFTRGARIRLDPNQTEAAVLIDGRPPEPMPAPEGPVRTGLYSTWDWQNERLIIDAPTAKVYVGRTCDACTFSDGIVLSGFDTPWIAFSIISQDGKPLAETSQKAWVSAVYDAKNTGFDYDYTVAGGPMEQARAVRKTGHAPVVVDTVGYTLSFPTQVDLRYTGFDFALRERGSREIAKGNVLRQPPQDDWMGVLEFTARGAAMAAMRDTSPGAAQAGTQAGADLPVERTDAAYAGFWNPIPDLSWGDSYHRAHRVIRDGGYLHGAVSAEDFSDAEEKVVTLPNAVILMDMPATLEARFMKDRMRLAMVTFEQAPAFVDLVAALRKSLGAPAREKLMATADQQSEVEWTVRRAEGTLSIIAAEVQGVVRLTCRLN
jgi:hypothetical protein